ncbi:ABC transporter F family member 4-like [Branchiostoma floridae]|uniref:ABC transporter F family member 4-like n=1 Tax=Branchiostoma floridae TaxID=7739 RepID=A0A9J7HGB6_BRAFL|nr:ABC transporter F family member 4-like [Branchiostoma floridae]
MSYQHHKKCSAVYDIFILYKVVLAICTNFPILHCDGKKCFLIQFQFQSTYHKGQAPPSKLLVKLEDYLAPPNTEWVQLEKARDALSFIETYQRIRKELSKSNDDDEEEESEEDMYAYKSDSPGTSPSKKGADMEEEEEAGEDMKEDGDGVGDDGDGIGEDGDDEGDEVEAGGAVGRGVLEDEDEGAPSPKKPRYVSKKGKKSALESGDDGDDNDDETEERPMERGNKKTKGKKGGREEPKQEFEKTVEKMRRLHPEVNTANDSQMLNKNAGGWRKAVAAQLKLKKGVREVSSNMATHVTVATMSPRCYQEALDIMSKWTSGQCQGQGRSLKPSQTIFKPLNGLSEEEEVFSLLSALRSGAMDKDTFEAQAKAKKKTTTKSQAGRKETARDVRELNKEKEKTKQEVNELNKEKEKTKQEVNELNKEKEKTKQEVNELKKKKETTESDVNGLKNELKKMKKEMQGEVTGTCKLQKDQTALAGSSEPPVLLDTWVGVWYNGEGPTAPGVWYPGKVENVLSGGRLKVKFIHPAPSSMADCEYNYVTPDTKDEKIVRPVFVIAYNLQVEEVSKGKWKVNVKDKKETDKTCKKFKPPSRK